MHALANFHIKNECSVGSSRFKGSSIVVKMRWYRVVVNETDSFATCTNVFMNTDIPTKIVDIC